MELLEHTLQIFQAQRRAPSPIPWDDDQIPPHYRGLGILNLPASVCQWLGVLPPFTHSPLDRMLVEGLPERFRRVILVLIDGLGLTLFRQALQQGRLAFWTAWGQHGRLAALTSIAPSTTAAALTTLWTGRSPAEHGVMAYEMWLKEYGLIGNMIFHAPAWFQGGIGSLAQAGFQPETFLPHPPLGKILRRHGVATYAVQPAHIARSGLSRMLLQDAELIPFHGSADLWHTLAQWADQAPTTPAYVWAYWSTVDTLSHRYGPNAPRVLDEIEHFFTAMHAFFLRRLSPAARRETLLIITADHGQIATPPASQYEVAQHPRLMSKLHLPPIGENRLAFLYPRPGRTRAMQAYFAQTWPEDFTLITAEQALSAGLFGPGRYHPSLRDRIGDWLALARKQAYLWWSPKPNDLRGRHGGLHRDEMLVPLLLLPLEAH